MLARFPPLGSTQLIPLICSLNLKTKHKILDRGLGFYACQVPLFGINVVNPSHMQFEFKKQNTKSLIEDWVSMFARLPHLGSTQLILFEINPLLSAYYNST